MPDNAKRWFGFSSGVVFAMGVVYAVGSVFIGDDLGAVIGSVVALATLLLMLWR